MIFSRNRGKATPRPGVDPLRPGRHTRDRRADDRAAEETADELRDATQAAADRGFGPYDLKDAPADDVERLDLGALRIPAVPGVEIQLQAGQQGEITGLVLIHNGSQMQLGVFAAPRTEGIWDEIRDLVKTNLVASGAKPEDLEGDYGLEVRARVRDESGATAIVRHVGVDGPRWFVHAVIYGAAAADPSSSREMTSVLRGLLVDRGIEARPVREALPLRLPPQAQQQLADAAERDAAGEAVNGAVVDGSAYETGPDQGEAEHVEAEHVEAEHAEVKEVETDQVAADVADPPHATPPVAPAKPTNAKPANRPAAKRQPAATKRSAPRKKT